MRKGGIALRIKELFTIPKDEKITEKAFARVLLSSVCSILLCMTCLAGTTWAWFTVSLENTGNVIQIGTAEVNASIISIDGEEPVPDATLLVGADDDEDGGGINLPAGTYVFKITHASDYDDLDTKSTLYVTLTATGKAVREKTDGGETSDVENVAGEVSGGEIAGGETIDTYVCGYVVLDRNNNYATTVTIQVAENCSLSMDVSWFAPANAELLKENILVYPVIDETAGTTAESTEGITESTVEGSTEASTEETGEFVEQPTQETTGPEESSPEIVETTELEESSPETAETTESEKNTTEAPADEPSTEAPAETPTEPSTEALTESSTEASADEVSTEVPTEPTESSTDPVVEP